MNEETRERMDNKPLSEQPGERPSSRPHGPSSYRIPARFHPGRSPLGRLIRRLTADRWQADALYLAALVLGGTALLLAHLVAWNLTPATLAHTPAWFAAEIALALVVAALSLIGWQPGIAVRCDATGLHLRQSRRRLTVAPDDVTDVEVVSARHYHRHERRYAGTRVFVNRVPGEVLLVRTEETVVAIGLATESERAALRRRLEARCLSSDARERKPVAAAGLFDKKFSS